MTSNMDPYELLKDYKDVVTVEEVATILKVNKKHVYKLLEKNKIPYFDISLGERVCHRILKLNVIKFMQNEQ